MTQLLNIKFLSNGTFDLIPFNQEKQGDAIHATNMNGLGLRILTINFAINY